MISKSFTIVADADCLKGKLEPELTKLVKKNKKQRSQFISNIISNLSKYNLQGVDIHFEDIPDRNSKNFISFEKKLYQSLHAKKLLVMQQV